MPKKGSPDVLARSQPHTAALFGGVYLIYFQAGSLDQCRFGIVRTRCGGTSPVAYRDGKCRHLCIRPRIG